MSATCSLLSHDEPICVIPDTNIYYDTQKIPHGDELESNDPELILSPQAEKLPFWPFCPGMAYYIVTISKNASIDPQCFYCDEESGYEYIEVNLPEFKGGHHTSFLAGLEVGRMCAREMFIDDGGMKIGEEDNEIDGGWDFNQSDLTLIRIGDSGYETVILPIPVDTPHFVIVISGEELSPPCYYYDPAEQVYRIIKCLATELTDGNHAAFGAGVVLGRISLLENPYMIRKSPRCYMDYLPPMGCGQRSRREYRDSYSDSDSDCYWSDYEYGPCVPSSDSDGEDEDEDDKSHNSEPVLIPSAPAPHEPTNEADLPGVTPQVKPTVYRVKVPGMNRAHEITPLESRWQFIPDTWWRDRSYDSVHVPTRSTDPGRVYTVNLPDRSTYEGSNDITPLESRWQFIPDTWLGMDRSYDSVHVPTRSTDPERVYAVKLPDTSTYEGSNR